MASLIPEAEPALQAHGACLESWLVALAHGSSWVREGGGLMAQVQPGPDLSESPHPFLLSTAKPLQAILGLSLQRRGC